AQDGLDFPSDELGLHPVDIIGVSYTLFYIDIHERWVDAFRYLRHAQRANLVLVERLVAVGDDGLYTSEMLGEHHTLGGEYRRGDIVERLLGRKVSTIGLVGQEALT